MAEVKNYRLVEKAKPERIFFAPNLEFDTRFDWNEDIVETAGFVPLAVKFKQMEQAGIQAKFLSSEFTSRDVSDMYLNHPELDLTGEEDYEEAMEKIQARAAYIRSVKEAVKARNNEAQREVGAAESVAKGSDEKTASEEKEHE